MGILYLSPEKAVGVEVELLERAAIRITLSPDPVPLQLSALVLILWQTTDHEHLEH